jgi:hypothetical protein
MWTLRTLFWFPVKNRNWSSFMNTKAATDCLIERSQEGDLLSATIISTCKRKKTWTLVILWEILGAHEYKGIYLFKSLLLQKFNRFMHRWMEPPTVNSSIKFHDSKQPWEEKIFWISIGTGTYKYQSYGII